MDELMRQVDELYERAIFNGEYDGLPAADRALDTVEARLLLQRGRILHCRFLQPHADPPEDVDRSQSRAEQPGESHVDPVEELAYFERAADLFRGAGDERGEAEALFWIGCFHQVVRDDNPTAIPFLSQAADLSRKTGDQLTLSYALRHLGIAAHMADDYPKARDLLEESTALRRTLNFTAGVAANLVGLIYLAIAQNRPDDARALAAEATTLATTSGATKITEQIEAARSRI
ncbi:tetratricopeptide repeat protein [Kribbella sp. VKM Ac-2566]|uniref:tetratricopeptide repeat protein n=1 Tax=Kribbella sp. VKM Ac-2566 TaxID=2512218 RepID=UPI001EE00141|nr:tetratricopeptide repeat protein [Kribbella sp. VKM Ac-2566]